MHINAINVKFDDLVLMSFQIIGPVKQGSLADQAGFAAWLPEEKYRAARLAQDQRALFDRTGLTPGSVLQFTIKDTESRKSFIVETTVDSREASDAGKRNPTWIDRAKVKRMRCWVFNESAIELVEFVPEPSHRYFCRQTGVLLPWSTKGAQLFQKVGTRWFLDKLRGVPVF